MNRQLGNLDKERFNKLLMGMIDNELTEQEQAEFKHLVNEHPELNQEWEHYQN